MRAPVARIETFPFTELHKFGQLSLDCARISGELLWTVTGCSEPHWHRAVLCGLGVRPWPSIHLTQRVSP